jgi:glycosyltransferase involved in cell wall biosynthesis
MSVMKLNENKISAHDGPLPLASVIITSYNYEKFLSRAIDSALQQTYPMKEIIVVDDGSTDNSRSIIKGYGDQILPVFKENGGITSATNAGFFRSHGEIIFFLDSDDFFSPHKVETMVNYYLRVIPQTPDALISHRLEIRSNDGSSPPIYRPRNLRTLDGKKKNGPLAKISDPSNAYRYIQNWGFFPSINFSASGLSLTRSLASKIFPLPEGKLTAQDAPLVYAAMLLGTVYGTVEVLGAYIIHGDNTCLKQAWLDEKIERFITSENFLNDILQKMNKKRIASFFESRRAALYYQYSGSTKKLLKLAWKIPARSFCWETIWFSIQTQWHCLKSALGIKKKKRDTKKKVSIKIKERETPQHHQHQSSVSKGD